MRRHLIWVLALAAAIVSVGVASIASAVPNTQLITGSFTPKKLPKKKRAPIKLFTDVSATNPGNPNQIPYPTTLAKVDYDKDGAFYQKGFETCDPTQFTAATTTAQAKSACSDSQIGTGGSEIAVPTGPSTPPLNVTALVTAFNGAGKTVVLHTYNSLSGAQTLVGKIGPADKGSPPAGAGPGYGITLTVPVPPLAGGTAVITQFDATVKKTYTYRGKKRSLFSSRCGPGKTLNVQARFTDNQGQVAVGTGSQKCKQKKG
jgi:hypothetical protein